MTAKQSNQIVTNPNTKKAIAVLRKFAELEVTYKELEKESKAAVEQLKEAMIENNIPKIEFDPELTGISGYVTLAERINYKVESIADVQPKFLKKVLDTDKVKASATLTGELPKGVSESRTQFITKKIKVEN